MSSAESFNPDAVQFVDHRTVEWSRVKRTRYFCYQCFRYDYPGPVHNLRQNLVVVPMRHYGDQRLCEHRLTVTPSAATMRDSSDYFGNRVFKLEVPRVEKSVAFEVTKTVERRAGRFRPVALTHDQLAYYRRPTDLTAADERIAAIAGEFAARTRNVVELTDQISDFVAGAMSYGSGATAVTTTAAEALAIGKGLCQDYAHIMLAICRSAGVAARYVSGHMLGEGGSHAWVEALLPSPDRRGIQVLAFDPTNRRRPNLGYTTVATGRDYSDVPPTSGSFTAPYGGCLSFSKRAGLTLVEYTDGEVMESGC